MERYEKIEEPGKQIELDFSPKDENSKEEKKISVVTDEEYAKLSEKSDDYYEKGQW